ncbi:MAG: hypothetical protein JO249_13105, partial [Acidobacteria bacterium]|nr:hypothetical protein [Acidobacteriota bacterium]
HAFIPVHFDPVTGFITVGSTTYCGGTPNPGSGFHLLALSRQPDPEHPDAPDELLDKMFLNAYLLNNALKQLSSTSGGPIVMVNAVGDYGIYGITLSAVAQGLKPFGSYGLQSINAAPPFIFISNAGRNPQTALQRGYSTLPLDGYLVQDSNGNYTFTQTDFVHYDMTTVDGAITIGGTTYDVASSYQPGCSGDASNSFHLVVVDRESLQLQNINNTYCTAQSNSEISRLVGDMSAHLDGNPNALAFLVSNGHPIPADWSFGTDGDARIYPLAQQVAKLGGYWETMVYLTPTDTYSLVGAAPFAPQPRPRAQESSSVYPVDVNGIRPSGDLHGVLARGVGNWYSPLNADPTGTANLGLYDIMGQPPLAFPHPKGAAEVSAFRFINQNLCGSSSCNVRNQYGNLDINIGTTYETPLTVMLGPNGTNCNSSPPPNPIPPFCVVRAQLLQEFRYVSNIRNFYNNVTGLWSDSGSTTLAEQLGAYNTVLANIPTAPKAAPAPSLAGPIVNLFLGLAKFIPDYGPVFGLADVFFNFGTALTTDPKGNQTINLTSTIGNLYTQAAAQFVAQANTTGTLFEFIYQDWGKLHVLGTDLNSASGPASPWYWSSTETSQMLQAMGPAIQQGAYRNIMPAAYAIGSYVPQSNDNCAPPAPNWNPPVWGQTPLYLQQWSYGVLDGSFTGCPWGVTPVIQPFNSAVGYIPYTYPTDLTNPYRNNATTGTILADSGWLGISALGTPYSSNNGAYEPPAASLLSTLFTPLSQTLPNGNPGLGVYRPAFFESWPFPRITCAPAYNVPSSDGGSYVGGCPWPAPPQ